MNLGTLALLGAGGFIGYKVLTAKSDDDKPDDKPPPRVGPTDPYGGNTAEPQRIEGAMELDDEGIQRKWTHADATVALVTMPAWVRIIVVTVRVEVSGRRLELDNTKTYFHRCGDWQFQTNGMQPGQTLPATLAAVQPPSAPGKVPAVLNGGYVPIRVPGCGDGGDDWFNVRKYNLEHDQPPPLWQVGTPWWLRARARVSLGRKLEVQLIYPTDAYGASNKDGGQFRGNKYNIDVRWVLRDR